MRAIAAVAACIYLLGATSGVSGQALTPSTPPLSPNTPPLAPDTPPVTANTAPLTPNTPPLTPSTSPAPANAPATVTTLATFTVGNWAAAAYTAAGSTAFDHCAGATPYRNGITLAFAVTRTFQWSMGFFDPAWQLVAGTTYPVAFAIDSSPPDTATATAINVSSVEVPLTPNVALFKRFMEGERLKVVAASENFIFDLTQTSELLPDLLRCVESYVGAAPPSSNPFVSSAAN
jgi:hypothetical protein